MEGFQHPCILGVKSCAGHPQLLGCPLQLRRGWAAEFRQLPALKQTSRPGQVSHHLDLTRRDYEGNELKCPSPGDVVFIPMHL